MDKKIILHRIPCARIPTVLGRGLRLQRHGGRLKDWAARAWLGALGLGQGKPRGWRQPRRWRDCRKCGKAWGHQRLHVVLWGFLLGVMTSGLAGLGSKLLSGLHLALGAKVAMKARSAVQAALRLPEPCARFAQPRLMTDNAPSSSQSGNERLQVFKGHKRGMHYGRRKPTRKARAKPSGPWPWNWDPAEGQAMSTVASEKRGDSSVLAAEALVVPLFSREARPYPSLHKLNLLVLSRK